MPKQKTIGYLKMSDEEQLQLAIPSDAEILEARTVRQVPEVEVFAEAEEVEVIEDGN